MFRLLLDQLVALELVAHQCAHIGTLVVAALTTADIAAGADAAAAIVVVVVVARVHGS